MSRYRPTLLRKDTVSDRWTPGQAKDGDPSSTGRPNTIVLPSTSTTRSAADTAAQTAALRAKFPDLTKEDLLDLINQFHAIPASKAGWITQSAAISAGQRFENGSYNRARETMKKVHADGTNTVDLEDWVEFATLMRSARPSTMVPGKRSGTSQMRGSDADISHTIDDQGERVEYTEYINSALASDPDVSARLPIPTDTMQIFDECRDGIIICKLVEHFYPGTIDSVMGIRRRKGTTFINLPSGNHTLNKFQMAENNNIAILAAQEIGANMVNINAQDLMAGREHLILSLIGQIIRLGKSDKPRPPSRQRPTTPSGKRPTTPSLKRPTTPSAPHQRPTTPSAPLQRNRSATLPTRPTRAPPSPPRSHRSVSMSFSVDDDDVTRVASPLSAVRGESSAQKGINQSQLRSKLREKGTFRLFEDLKGGIIILEALDKVSPVKATPTTALPTRNVNRPSTPSATSHVRPSTPSATSYARPSTPSATSYIRKPERIPKATPVVQPTPRPLVAKESPPLSRGGMGLGIDEGIIAQRRALLFSITSRA